MVWPTSAKVVLFETRAGDRLAGPRERCAVDLSARYVGGVTKVTESRELPDGKTWIAKIFARTALGGDENHDRHLRRGMEKTLRRIKDEVECRAVVTSR